MLVIAESATPIVLLDERTSARASVFGAKPMAAIASSTARAVSGAPLRVLLRTCDTVVTDSPARFATSIMVATVEFFLASSLKDRSFVESPGAAPGAEPRPGSLRGARPPPHRGH